MDSAAGAMNSIRIGISACLLGHEVRYDGGHKYDRHLIDAVSKYFELVPVCPEVEFGLGVPRETIELVQLGDGVRLLTTETRIDLTERMRAFAGRRVAALAKEDICGYVLKKNSPSCGLEGVKIHQPNGEARPSGRGLFAEVLMERFPDLPVDEEDRLCDARLREKWIERVFAYHALKNRST